MRSLDRVFLVAGIASLSMLIAVSSCDDNEKAGVVKPTKEALEETIDQGVWRVTYFFDEKDETGKFSGYQFEFKHDGTATVSGASSASGVWSAFESSSGVKLIMEFPVTGPLEELNDDWEVVEQTDSKIRLKHVSGGSGEVDVLTFEKV